MGWQIAQDTFNAEVEGAPVTVVKGDFLPDEHPVVKLDAGRQHLFKAAPPGVYEPPAKSAAAKAQPPAKTSRAG